jgi:hypothetical protein
LVVFIYQNRTKGMIAMITRCVSNLNRRLQVLKISMIHKEPFL